MSAEDLERVPTGVNGLDELIQGGVPKHHTVFLAGPSGSGKTTFGLEYLYRGATEYDDPGLYVSFEETQEELLQDLPFNWDLKSVIDDGQLNIIKYDPYQYEDIVSLIRSTIRENDAERVVIDSLTALSLYIESVKDVRKLIMDMNEMLRTMETTTFYIGEITSGNPDEISRFGVEEFIADGVIVLIMGRQGAELSNQVLVRKMRGTDHDKNIHPFKFEDRGLKVYAKETALPSGEGESSDLF